MLKTHQLQVMRTIINTWPHQCSHSPSEKTLLLKSKIFIKTRLTRPNFTLSRHFTWKHSEFSRCNLKFKAGQIVFHSNLSFPVAYSQTINYKLQQKTGEKFGSYNI